jgi:hypothetical protein
MHFLFSDYAVLDASTECLFDLHSDSTHLQFNLVKEFLQSVTEFFHGTGIFFIFRLPFSIDNVRKCI